MMVDGLVAGPLRRAAAVLALGLALVAGSNPSSAAAQAKTGALQLRLVGLPRGERIPIRINGPSPTGGHRSTRRVTVAGVSTLRRTPAGVYRISLDRVKLRRRHGRVKRGAVASPVRRQVTVRVRPRRTAKTDLRYGTIVNPGVRSASGHILAVIGEPVSPDGLRLRRAAGIHRGTILSAHPSRQLPHGLLARVTGIRRKGRVTSVKLSPADIYDVAPNMNFDVPLSIEAAAQVSAGFQCGANGSSISPYARISDVHLTGGWVTTHVLFADITNGATVELHFKVATGLDVTTGASLSCSVSLPVFAVQGMAGPIPVYGAIKARGKGEVAGQAKLHTEGSTDLTLGGTITVPGAPRPILGFGSPHFSFGSDLFAGFKGSIGLDAELGVGAAEAANLHLGMANSLNFTAGVGNCSWDLDLGSFSLVGKVGPFTVSSPSSPPLFHRNLWHRTCGSAPGSAPVAPTPPAPPSPTGPLTRATMSWDTDSDIDLYTWDDQGNVLFYGEREGIPDAQLIEDVIPLPGEFEHPPEVFQETADYNRPYTFGICDYHGEGADVTLTVVDPGGGTRSYDRTLEFAGDSAVVTSSPVGVDYSPPWEWCHYAEEFEEFE